MKAVLVQVPTHPSSCNDKVDGVGVAAMALGLSMVVWPKKHQAALIAKDSVQIIGAGAMVMGGVALYGACLSW